MTSFIRYKENTQKPVNLTFGIPMHLIVIDNHPIKVLNIVKVDNKNLISIRWIGPNKTMKTKHFHHKI